MLPYDSLERESQDEVGARGRGPRGEVIQVALFLVHDTKHSAFCV